MNIKKVLAIVTVALFTVSMCGCNKGSGKKKNTPAAVDLGGETVKIASNWDWTDMLTPGLSIEWDSWQARIAKAEEEFNCKIECVTLPSYAGDASSLTTKLISGECPADIMYVNNTLFNTWRMGGLIEDLSQYNVFDFDDSYVWLQSQIKAATVAGKTYAVWESEPNFYSMIAFNKKMFADKGVKTPYDYVENKEWSLDKMIEVAKQMTVDSNGDGTAEIYGFAPYNESQLTMDLLDLYGGTMFDYDSDGKIKFNLGNEAGMNALNKLQEFGTGSFMYPSPEGAAYDQSMREFMNGKVAMVEVARWMLDEFVKVDGLEFGVTYFPMLKAGDEYVSTSIMWNGYCIPTTCTKDKLGVAQVLNCVFGSTDDHDELDDRLRTDLERVTQDSQSIDNIMDVLRSDRINFLMDGSCVGCYWNVGEDTCLYPDNLINVARNAQSPKQLIEATQDPIQSYLDETYNSDE